MQSKIKVFIDTNILLNSYATWKNNGDMPIYLTDNDTDKFTFEKCIYESYMAFRGVGGKKPDEGRGDWAQRHLRSKNDPIPVGNLSGKFHNGNNYLTHYWINQIEEGFHSDEDWERIRKNIRIEDLEVADKEQEGKKELYKNKLRFERLADEYLDFISKANIHILSYAEVFDKEYKQNINFSVYNIDSLIRQTVIPSEDFEIVYAAMTIKADLFITNDSKLITCSASLGLNLPLHPSSFISANNYEEMIYFLREERKS